MTTAALPIVTLLAALAAGPSVAPDQDPSEAPSAAGRAGDAVVNRRDAAGPGCGLVLEEGWQKAAADKDLVVSVHGVNAGPRSMENLLAGPRKAGFPCAAFDYPNDRAIADSARLLSEELKRFGRAHPDRGVVLLTHSMGGLIARAAVEDPALDPGDVRRLVMVSPPNHGSMLARLVDGLDLFEQVRDKDRKQEAGFFYAMVENVFSEAYGDLKPGSPFLTKLNARKRNPKVRYSIFLGTSALFSAAEWARVRQGVSDPKDRWLRLLGEKVRPWLADMDEVVDGKGDGAVAVKRGRLEGVADTHELKFTHIGVLHPPGGDDDVKKLHQMILARLRGKSR